MSDTHSRNPKYQRALYAKSENAGLSLIFSAPWRAFEKRITAAQCRLCGGRFEIIQHCLASADHLSCVHILIPVPNHLTPLSIQQTLSQQHSRSRASFSSSLARSPLPSSSPRSRCSLVSTVSTQRSAAVRRENPPCLRKHPQLARYHFCPQLALNHSSFHPRGSQYQPHRTPL